MYYVVFASDADRKFQDISQRYQNLQSSHSTSTESELKMKVILFQSYILISMKFGELRDVRSNYFSTKSVQKTYQTCILHHEIAFYLRPGPSYWCCPSAGVGEAFGSSGTRRCDCEEHEIWSGQTTWTWAGNETSTGGKLFLKVSTLSLSNFFCGGCIPLNHYLSKFQSSLNFLSRETKENSSLLKEETEGLRRKLERMERVMEEKLKVELEKEVNACRSTVCHWAFSIILLWK